MPSIVRFRLRQIVFASCLFLVVMVVLRSFVDVNNPLQHTLSDHETSSKLVCQHPKLELNNPQFDKFFTKLPPLNCGISESDWVCVEGNVATLCDRVATKHPITRCNYTFFDRVSDHENYVVARVSVEGDRPVKLISDFFHVHCDDQKDSKRFWKNIMTGFHSENETLELTSSTADLQADAMRLNVLMFGIDSLSRMTFMRKLPLTYEYLTKELGTVVLKGYNIVGDGTPQALIPILTGKTERELPETRKRMPDATYVNAYPFVWNDFSDTGYVTAFGEDAPNIGTFTYRLKGFNQQPTNHYLRPFYVEFEKVKFESQKYCVGSRAAHKVMMDWVLQFFNVYQERHKFMFAFHGELSHDDYNLIGHADEDLKDMLRTLKEMGHLNRTMLILMSDHGHRFSGIRETQQGKQEERLPFFSFTLPSWFKNKHRTAYENLVVNSDRLTSPFDIYPTLKSVLHYKEDDFGVITDRGISLFTEIPESRRCEDAGIEAHWCACLSWKSVLTTDSVVKVAAEHVVSFINTATKPYRPLCHSLSLGNIVWANKYVPRSDMLHFKKNADVDGFEGDFSDNTTISEVVFQLMLSTVPGDAHFEVSIIHKQDRNLFVVGHNQISRVNSYGNTAACIVDLHQDLRKFCFCKN